MSEKERYETLRHVRWVDEVWLEATFGDWCIFNMCFLYLRLGAGCPRCSLASHCRLFGEGVGKYDVLELTR